MHGPNHGCPKCVINYPMVGPIAELLATTVGTAHALHKPALALAAAANAAAKVYDHVAKLGLRTMPDEHEFAGCHEASKLMAHIAGGQKVTVGWLKQVRTDILGHLAELVSNADIPTPEPVPEPEPEPEPEPASPATE